MSQLTQISSNKSFGGVQQIFSHESKVLGCRMNFAIFLPDHNERRKLPVIYWLSGLACNETNFIFKSGAQKYAAEAGVVIVCPDTSPRGLNIPGDSTNWDFGVGAGFYVDATKAPWDKNYKMFSYVTQELLQLIPTEFPVLENKQSIMGHSMGGHGALICALKNPGLYKCVSAFAPICNPSNCPWGKKAFEGYLGPKEQGEWTKWDSTELVQQYEGPHLDIYIDQGSDDQFLLDKQLLPENFLQVAKLNKNVTVNMRNRVGYDHSYYYIATFIEEHIKNHAEHLYN